MSNDSPNTSDGLVPVTNNEDGMNSGTPTALARPDLKRTLRDLLVQDEVSDSDVEMLEKHASTPLLQDDDPPDPDMCVECGDQVSPNLPRLLRGQGTGVDGRELRCGVCNARNSFARFVIII